MIKIVGVKFKSVGKTYYFDPAGHTVSEGDNVIVETTRGIEFGTITSAPHEVREEEIIMPLKSIVRVASEEDKAIYEENLNKKDEALKICEEAINHHGLEMKLIDVEYTFDNSKVIFYFTADGRVDFRELVKDLASKFRIRIELRQIGVRDEAKFIGGIGTCGRPLCCSQWLSDFQPVSIKMAKTQGLSLNPAKISGICGRLMCCLKYENDVYNEQKKGMPEQGEHVEVNGERCIVVETSILLEQIKVCRILEKGKEGEADKLDNEVLLLEKGEFKRLGRKNKKHEEELPDEIKQLLDE